MQLAVTPPTLSHADIRSTEILASVRQTFVEKGFDGASMQDLARAAGMSVGNFYRYFPSKAAIIQARPVPLDIGAGAEAAVEHAKAALDDGARVIAFGETFLGGYPIWLDEAPAAGTWDHPGVKALHAILLRQAIVAGPA